MMDARATASRILAQLFSEGRSLADTLPMAGAKLAPAERALAQELCYGVARWYPRLAALLQPLLRKPLKERDQDIYCLLLAGIYQLQYLRIPDYAAVSASVAAARALGKPWAAGLVNAVLRGYQRDSARLLAQIEHEPVAHWAHPAWWIERLRAAWPDHWQTILAANNERPPMSLRVNARQADRETYLAQLAAAGMNAHPVPHAACGITLATPVEVGALPGFQEGRISVQDGAAQLAAPLLDVHPGMRVLDACAAPGGKTAHIYESQPELAEIVAVEENAARMTRMRETLARLHAHATLVTADAGEPAAWWDGTPFDRILLDAPCSGSGVIRRHPDIKRLRRAEDIAALAARQQRLLHALWPLLRPGGMLLYVTCSVLPEENGQQVDAFLRAHPDARADMPDVAWGHPAGAGRQILPGEEGMDGFYYARLIYATT